jgi:ATP-dependent RNA helicase DDX52/ROK1
LILNFFSIVPGVLDISLCRSVVLDEADRLFEEGFLEQIDTILEACRRDKAEFQTCMFSATMPQGIESMITSVLRDPVSIRVGAEHAAAAGADTIDQKLVFVGREEGKLLAVRQIVQKGLKPPIIMFVQSIERAQALFRELVYDGINVDVIHADRSQAQRDQVIKKFRTGEVWVLIATDLMARGMDFKGVNCVINYDFPQSVISYVHRIGRTGRAGRPGEAITFFTESDMTMLRSIANVMKLSGCDVPDWMLTMKKLRNSDRKRLKQIPVKRPTISTTSSYDKKKRNNREMARKSSKRAKSDGKEWQSKTDRKKARKKETKDDDGGGDGGGWTVVE